MTILITGAAQGLYVGLYDINDQGVTDLLQSTSAFPYRPVFTRLMAVPQSAPIYRFR